MPEEGSDMDPLYQFIVLSISDQVQIIQAIASIIGLGCIVGGLFQMKKAGRRRDREIDELAAAFQRQGQAFERQGEALGQMLERQSQALERHGEALERQSQALERHGEALERQSQVLAELLRRTT